ncbi:MAG: hypothetical protein NTU47_03860 [Ignavibacteriales bacterium]|nr:hypothetical protein [Ignavibacteriales bacterium]
MSQLEKRATITYLYKFKFQDGTEKKFEVVLDEATLELQREEPDPMPEWTKLKYEQCENCPLPGTVEYCPVAVSLAGLVESFSDSVSYQAADVTVETAQRTFFKKTTLQKGLSAIIGIYMSTSNCPVCDKLRPMTRFHLPFANSIETFFRSVSSYLTAQFLLMRQGMPADWDLKGLQEIYKEVNTVNKGMTTRLHHATEKDANINAVVILHSFGDGITYFIESGLGDLEPMFQVFLQKNESPDSESPR